MSNENKLPRAFTVRDLLQKKFNVLNFEGVWLDLIGKPELRGSWLIYGLSFQGKTRFVVQLAFYLSTFGKVIIDTLEEGFSQSMQTAFIGEKIPETETKIQDR